jgi:hypothetical protein
MKFEKGKRKKKPHRLLSAQAAQPTPAPAHHSPFPFSFTPRRRQSGPTCQPPFFPLPFLLPRAHRPPPQPRGIRPAPAFSPSFLSPVSTLIKAINPHSNPPAVSPFPLPSLRPDGPPAINGKPPAAPSPTRLAFHHRVLFKLAHALLCLPLPLQPANAHARAPISRAAASGLRRRRRAVAAGEGLDPPVFCDLWDR